MTDLDQVLARMRAASADFYLAAIHTGNHAFVEFTGLMNEYIEICEATRAARIDFTQANVHTGQELVAHQHHLQYLREKLACIYGPTIAAAAMDDKS